jgi:hypothetical protein
MALIERACSMMGTPAPVSNLASQLVDYDARINALVGDDEDLGTYVSRLEDMVDEMGTDDDDDPNDGSVPRIDDSDPERLAAEVEQFLRDRTAEG